MPGLPLPSPPPMPGAPPPGFPGAAPPSPAGTGPALAPGPHAGSANSGVASVRTGLEALQKALPQIPMGSKLHRAVMKSISDISKEMESEGKGGGDSSGMMQQLVELARNARTNPNAAAAMPPGGSPGGSPPGPAMPPMGG